MNCKIDLFMTSPPLFPSEWDEISADVKKYIICVTEEHLSNIICTYFDDVLCMMMQVDAGCRYGFYSKVTNRQILQNYFLRDSSKYSSIVECSQCYDQSD